MLKETTEERKEREAIKFLEARGYSVLPKNRTILTWNRTLPYPEGLNFQKEALDKIREQLGVYHIHFVENEIYGTAILRLQ